MVVAHIRGDGRSGGSGGAAGARGGGRLPEAAEPPGGLVLGRRIRDDARDGVYVMAFSLSASATTVLTLVLLTKLAG